MWKETNMCMRSVLYLNYFASKVYVLCALFVVSKVLYFQVPSKTGGPPEKKEVLLEDHDPVWLELRHAHIADVCP